MRKQAASGGRWTGVATALRIATQLLQLAVLARLLNVSDFGLMAMVNVVVSFGQAFGDLGMSNAIIHYQDATRRELSSLYWLNLLGGAMVFAVVWACTPLVVRFYHEPRLHGLLPLAALVFLIIPLGQQFQVLLERGMLFRRVAFVDVSSNVAGAVVGITSAWAGQGVYSLVWALLSYTGVRAVGLAAVGWTRWRPALHFRPRECRRFMAFASYQMGERTMNLLSQQLDKLLIGALMGAEPLGYYDLAYRLIARPYQLINPIFTRVAYPVFARVQEDTDRLRKGFLELIELVAAVIAPIYVALLALAGPIVGLQFGAGYETTIGLLRILAILGFFYGLGNPLGAVLLARGRADAAFYMNVGRIVMFAVAVWIGSRFGLQAIAWSLVLAVAGVLFPVGLWIRWWLIRLAPGPYFRAFGPFLVAAVVAGAAVYHLGEASWWPDAAVALAVTLPLAAGIYFGILFLWQRDRLRRMLATMRG